MRETPVASLSELFDQLADLDEAQREAALDALNLDAPLRNRLQLLLDADLADTSIVRATMGRASVELAEESSVSGQHIGPYRVLREIGAGGMGMVYLAERADEAYVAQVAIKLIRGFPTEEGRRRFRGERQILAGLDHPNIARLLDGGETDGGQPYLVVEYVEGLQIMNYAAEHAPTLQQRLQLYDLVLGAVAHAHTRLVIHRDIKPANILVRSDGTPKLLDFGVAKLMDVTDDGHSAETSTRVFSKGYASPEQQAGAAVGTAADVYSLGILLSELLGWSRGPSASMPAISPVPYEPELGAVIGMATCVDLVGRYDTVTALRADLQRFKEGLPVLAWRQTRHYRLSKFVQRHRWALIAAALLSIGTGAFVVQLRIERAEAVAAREQAEAANASLETNYKFLIEVFLGAGAKNKDGSAPSAIDLISRVEEQIDSTFTEAGPERLRMLELVANSYRNALRFEDAARVASALVDQDQANPDTLERVTRMALLALSLSDAGREKESVEVSDLGISILQAHGSDAMSLELQGRLHSARYQALASPEAPELAAEAAARGAEFARKHLAANRPIRLQLLANSARELERRMEFAALLVVRREVMAASQGNDQLSQSDVIWHALNLARALRYNGMLDESEKQLNEAGEMLTRSYGAGLVYPRFEWQAEQFELSIARRRLDQAEASLHAFDALLKKAPDMFSQRGRDSMQMSLLQLQGRVAESLAIRDRLLSQTTNPYQRRLIEWKFAKFDNATR